MSWSHGSRLARFALKLASALGAGALVAATPAGAQTVAPDQAPAAWMRYAEAATQSITAWLQAESEAGIGLRSYLDATRPAPDQPTAPLLLKVWIDAEGTVSRIDHPAFAYAQANADLRGLIVGQRLPAAPPKHMLLPLRIMIQLPPVPVPGGGEDVGAVAVTVTQQAARQGG